MKNGGTRRCAPRARPGRSRAGRCSRSAAAVPSAGSARSGLPPTAAGSGRPARARIVGGEVGQLDQPGLPGRGRLQGAGAHSGPAQRREPQPLAGTGVREARDEHVRVPPARRPAPARCGRRRPGPAPPARSLGRTSSRGSTSAGSRTAPTSTSVAGQAARLARQRAGVVRRVAGDRCRRRSPRPAPPRGRPRGRSPRRGSARRPSRPSWASKSSPAAIAAVGVPARYGAVRGRLAQRPAGWPGVRAGVPVTGPLPGGQGQPAVHRAGVAVHRAHRQRGGRPVLAAATTARASPSGTRRST